MGLFALFVDAAVPSTCPHLNNFYDAAFYYQEQADASTPPHMPRPPRTPPLADLHTLFTYLHHLTLSTRRLRCLHPNCTRYSGRLHACIGCMYVGCMSHGHIAQHSRDSRHWCAVEVERGGLFCFHCSDYVYHREITKLQDKAKQEAVNKKRRREEATLTPYDQQLLRTYTTQHAPNDATLGLRGIHNLGNTCYLSVILQHFVHNPLLRNFFLSDMHNKSRCNNRSMQSTTGRSDLCLACDIDDLFAAFYSGDHTPYGPQSILTSVWRHAEHLSGYKQQDAHELYMSMLDGLHHYTEQGAAARVAGQTGPGGVPAMCPCIIHTVYGGLLRSDVQCGTCQTVSTTHEPMFDISLDLSSVIRSLPATPTAGSPAAMSLVECLRRFTTAEKLWQHDQFLCRTCKRVQRGHQAVVTAQSAHAVVRALQAIRAPQRQAV